LLFKTKNCARKEGDKKGESTVLGKKKRRTRHGDVIEKKKRGKGGECRKKVDAGAQEKKTPDEREQSGRTRCVLDGTTTRRREERKRKTKRGQRQLGGSKRWGSCRKAPKFRERTDGKKAARRERNYAREKSKKLGPKFRTFWGGEREEKGTGKKKK